MLPADTASTLPASRSKLVAASGVRGACTIGMVRGKARSTRTAKQGAAANSTQNAARQPVYCANMPPSAGPSRVAMPHIAEITPSARGQRCSANSRRIIVYQRADKVPAPRPWASRPARSTGIFGASAHSTQPSAKAPSASRYIVRAPKRASRRVQHAPPSSEATT